MKAPSDYKPTLYRLEGTATMTNKYNEATQSKRAVVVVAEDVAEGMRKIKLAVGENHILWFHTVTELTTEEAEQYR